MNQSPNSLVPFFASFILIYQVDLSLAFMHVIDFDVSGVCVFSDLSSSLHGPEFLCFALVDWFRSFSTLVYLE